VEAGYPRKYQKGRRELAQHTQEIADELICGSVKSFMKKEDKILTHRTKRR